MAKNRGAANLVGLAALGALGYKMLQDKKGNAAPVEDRTGASEAVPSGDLGDFNQANYGSGLARPDAGDASVAEAVQNAPRVTPVKAAAPKAAAKTRSVAPTPPNDSEAVVAPKGGSGGGRGPAFGEREAYEATRYKPRYTPPGVAPRSVAGARYPMTSLTREDVLKATEMKKGGAVKKMASGGVTRSSASKRADGIAQKGKTRGTMVMCGGGYAKGKK